MNVWCCVDLKDFEVFASKAEMNNEHTAAQVTPSTLAAVAALAHPSTSATATTTSANLKSTPQTAELHQPPPHLTHEPVVALTEHPEQSLTATSKEKSTPEKVSVFALFLNVILFDQTPVGVLSTLCCLKCLL